MTGDPARERELAKQPPQALLVVPDVRIDLGVGALEVDVGDEPRAAVTRACHVDDVELVALDDAVEVRVDEVQARRGPPVAEQPRLDVLDPQRLAQQRVVKQVDLADGEIVGGAPVGVDAGQLVST
jgi:hypothetical protein